MVELQELFQEVREACSTRSWSTGIELARTDAVDGVKLEAESATLRVRTPGKTVAPTVTLYLVDLEWDCDCDGGEDACEHVAAAMIAFRRARKEGRELPVSKKAGGRIRYELTVAGDRIVVARSVVSGESSEPLSGTLASLLHSAAGPRVEPSKVDLSIDALLTAKRLRSYPHDAFMPFLPLLAEADDVQLDGKSIHVDAAPIGPRAIVRDAPNRGAVVRFEAPTSLERVLIRGIAVTRDGDQRALRPLGLTNITGLKLEKLPYESTYSRGRMAELISEVLPKLRREADVSMLAKRLPEKQRAVAPHALIAVEQRGAALTVLPVIVYGDPPCARVDPDDRLVHLGGPVPQRDPRGERRAAAKLLAQLDLVTGRRVEFTGRDALDMARALAKFDGEIEGTAHRDRYPNSVLKPDVQIDAQNLELRMQAGDVAADQEAVLSAWKRGESVVPLLGGGWAELPMDWLGRHGARIEQLLAARKADGTLASHARPALAALCADLDHPPVAELDRLAPLMRGFEALPKATLPEDLTAQLRDYQRQGIDWLCFLRDAGLGAVLADDMGLGKTLQALTALRGRCLVVCPRSVVHNWADEIERFRPSLSHAIYHGPGRELDPRADVTLTTYALLRGDIELLEAVAWDCVVLDESQTIKNPESQVTQAAYRLRAEFRVTLSGTPVENRLEELWSQMHFANPGLLGGRSAFRDSFARPMEEGSDEAGQRLRDRIRPFVLRRTKAAVLSELPPRTDAVMHCELDARERDIYSALSLATRQSVVKKLQAGGGVMDALEALLRLRQAACDTRLVPGTESTATASSKIRRLMLALEQAAADGHKALVFSQWTTLLDYLEPELKTADIAFTRLDGSTKDRRSVVASFQDPEGPPVLLISLKAGGTGLNLTAADHVFLLDPWWNPAAEDQAADRAHRMGQDRPVMVYRLVAKDTVEERILALQAHKRSLADAALEGTARAAKLTRDDLLALFD